jgi:hypothetical protein
MEDEKEDEKEDEEENKRTNRGRKKKEETSQIVRFDWTMSRVTGGKTDFPIG